MITFIQDSTRVHVPSWVTNLDSFRRWADMDDFPEDGRIWFLKGEVWVDMSKEQILTHVQVKTKYYVVLGGLTEQEKSGMFLADGAFLTCIEADIAGIPDGLFVANETLASGAVRLVEGAETGFVELEGVPDMVLEVVSASSVHKDTVVLRQAYWEAGIREYWLVDVRQAPLQFDILRHTAKGYVPTRKQGGWMKSAIFGRSFRLTQRPRPHGHPEFALEMR